MTAAELLKPRKIVELDYPNSPFKIGDILTFDGVVWGCNEPQKFERNPEKYPHIFNPLNWWEHRKVEDMPKKVIFKGDNENTVFEILEWDIKRFIGYFKNDQNKEYYVSLTTWYPEYGYFPID